jgi:toxin ParE1/3/4
MRVIWAKSARSDLHSISRWIATDNPTAALAMVRRLRQAAALLENHPSIGRPGPEPGTRVLVVSGTPYLLPYRIHPNTVEILAVFHSSQQWPDSFD